MKKTILTTAILSAFLIGCKDNKTTTSDTSVDTEMVHDHDHENDGMALNNSWIKEIELDNGKKWEANLETTRGVDKMLILLEEIEIKTVEDYHLLASRLNDEKNIVVKECTMEGPSHDNLHVFLHPLIEKIDALGKVPNKDKGAEIAESIKENLNGYSNYFD